MLLRFVKGRDGTDAPVAVVPGSAPALKERIIREHHDTLVAGHSGVAKTVARIRPYFWWRSLERDVIVYVRTCNACSAGKSPPGKPEGKMVVTPVPSEPWDEVGVDFVGPLPKNSGYRYVCCVTDLFSGFVIAWPARDATARTFAENFIMKVVLPGYLPRAMRHDRGRSFQNALVKHLHHLFHILELVSSGYHPQFNGAVERTNGLFAQLMPQHLANDWPLLAQVIAAKINSSVCSVREETPFFSNHGRHP